MWWCFQTLFLAVIQILEVVKDPANGIKETCEFNDYVEYRHLVDRRLELYNTTGRTIRTKETNGKLIVEFLEANKMSNGERDVLDDTN